MRSRQEEAEGLLGHHDHDHGQCQHEGIARAEARCAALGLRLTAQRRQVLDMLLSSHVPMSAYEIMDRIGEGGRRPSPISVYRALDFLVQNRFAHRIESRNAFLACVQDHGIEPAVAGEEPVLAFLLCESCGAAMEAEPPQLAEIIGRLGAKSGFKVRSSVIELRGQCRRCAEAGVEAPPAAPIGDAA